MLATFARLFVITTLLIAFIGQGFANAYAQPCSPSEHTTTEVNTATIYSSDIEQHTERTSHQEDECCDLDCCDNNCSCLGSSCSAAVYLVPPATTFTAFGSLTTDYFSQTEHPISSQSYLYRPPIIA